MGLFTIGHDCKRYISRAKKGEVYTCVCGARYILVRTFPWRKWDYMGRAT